MFSFFKRKYLTPSQRLDTHVRALRQLRMDYLSPCRR